MEGGAKGDRMKPNPEVEKLAKRLNGFCHLWRWDQLSDWMKSAFMDMARYVLRLLAKARKDERKKVLDEIAEEGKKFKQGFACRKSKETTTRLGVKYRNGVAS